MDPQKLSQGDKEALLTDAILATGDLVLLSQVAQQNIFHKWEDMWFNHGHAKEACGSLPRDLIIWHLVPQQCYNTPGTGSWSSKS